MNGRIKELAEQAGITLSQKDYSFYWIESAEDIGKFAELIVRECAEVCRMKYAHSDEMSKQASLAFANDIKEHFGVEE